MCWKCLHSDKFSRTTILSLGAQALPVRQTAAHEDVLCALAMESVSGTATAHLSAHPLRLYKRELPTETSRILLPWMANHKHHHASPIALASDIISNATSCKSSVFCFERHFQDKTKLTFAFDVIQQNTVLPPSLSPFTASRMSHHASPNSSTFDSISRATPG